MKYLFYTSLFLSIIASCNSTKESNFFREIELKNYLQNVHQVSPASLDSTLVVLLQTGFCGACTKSDFEFLNGLQGLQGNKLFILEKENIIVREEIATPQDMIYIDRDFNMERYGLRIPDSYVILFKDNTVVYSEIIERDKYEGINKRLKLQN